MLKIPKSGYVRFLRFAMLATLPIATMNAAETPSLIVTIAADTVDSEDNQTSLREAIAHAGTLVGPDTITFDNALNGATITLTSGATLTGDAGGVIIDATALTNSLTLASTGANRIVVNNSILTLRGLKLTGAALAGGQGGGAVYSSGTLELDRCTLTGNSADFGGGAIFNEGTTTIKRSTLHTNSTAGNGGAIYNNGGTLTVENSTISGNTSTGDYSIYNNAILILLHCTVAGNTAGTSAAIYNAASKTLTVENCILGSGNTGNTDLDNAGTLTRVGANLAEKAPVDSGAGASSGPAVTVADPLLGALGNNGGPTHTRALQSGSPAIDAAFGSTTLIDQRGASRPLDGDNSGSAAADLGAFELGNTFLSGFVLSDGTLDPTFDSATTSYTASVLNAVTSVTITPTAAAAGATITVNGNATTSGNASAAIALSVGDNPINTVVTGDDGFTTRTYTVTVTRLPLPTSITVTTTADTGAGSLREIFDTVNTQANYTTIVFDASLAGETISMTTDFNPYPLVRPASGTLTIDGAAAPGLTIDGGGKNRPFFIYNGTVTIKNLAIANVQAKGGNGNGGGAGLGGAIFVYKDASVTVENVNFSICNATGGTNVGPQDQVYSGGGGMGGDAGFGLQPGTSSGGGGLGGNGGNAAPHESAAFGGAGGGGIRSGSNTAAGANSSSSGNGAAGGFAGGLNGGKGSSAHNTITGFLDGGNGGANGGGGGSGAQQTDQLKQSGCGGGGGLLGNIASIDGGFGGGGGGGGNTMENGSAIGSGGNGGFGGGGGGIGRSPFGALHPSPAKGGNGGFGGGGGGEAALSGKPMIPGNGGFGGAGGYANQTFGTHGFGAGAFGGLGAGGVAFVMAGGSFTLIDPIFTGSSFTAVPGAGGDGTGPLPDPQGIGKGLFLGGDTTIQVSDGTTVTLPALSDFIGGGDDPEARGGLIKTGLGTLVMGGNGSYFGGTTISGGVLSISAEDQLGATGKKITLNGGTLRITGTSMTTLTRPVTFVSGSIDIADAGNTFILPGGLVATGNFTKSGAGSLILPGLTTSGGSHAVTSGTLQLNNGLGGGGSLSVDSGATLLGTGQVSTAISGAGTITANNGPLVLGDLASANGFNLTGGTLNVGGNQVILLDQTRALLGVATNLAANGTLVTVNGLQLGNAASLDAAKTLTATGSATIQGAFINNGTVNGPTGEGQTLTMLNLVSGAGSFTGNTTFKGGYSPGNSPAAVTLENATFEGGHILTMEIGGTTQGTQYDHLKITGTADLGGVLVVKLLNNYEPAAGQSFDLIDGTTKGKFSRIILPALTEGLTWDSSQLATKGILTVIPKP